MKSIYNGIKIMMLPSESNPSSTDILHNNNFTCKRYQPSPSKLLHVDSLFINKSSQDTLLQLTSTMNSLQ
eukprot:3831023-Ditylum_brightwellii.AAC.1